MVDIAGVGYRLWIPHEVSEDMTCDGNVDVHVYLTDSAHYVCTFYTPEDLRELLERWRVSGEHAGGACVWDPSMIVVRDLRISTIRAAVEDLIASGDIRKAMQLCD